MNDRFKFRVWNNKHNRYIVDSHYPIGSDHIIVIKQDGKAYNLGLGDYEDYSNMHSWAVMEEFTDYIVEQCTGLKDKNGNLIYEGDIIRFCLNNRGYVLAYERAVIWDKETAGFMVVSNLDQVKPRTVRHLPDIKTHNIEIIGNIHEQKEEK